MAKASEELWRDREELQKEADKKCQEASLFHVSFLW